MTQEQNIRRGNSSHVSLATVYGVSSRSIRDMIMKDTVEFEKLGPILTAPNNPLVLLLNGDQALLALMRARISPARKLELIKAMHPDGGKCLECKTVEKLRFDLFKAFDDLDSFTDSINSSPVVTTTTGTPFAKEDYTSTITAGYETFVQVINQKL